MNSEDPDEEMQGVDVLLLNGEDLVARTKATGSGEFDLECEPDRNLRLFINIRGYRAIGITVPDV